MEKFKPEPRDETFPYHVAGYYRYGDELNSKLDEFNIFYTKESTPKDIISFCRAYKDRKINVSFTEKLDIDLVTQLAALFGNVRVRLKASDIQQVGGLQEAEVPFFFDYREIPANTYGQLFSLLSMRVAAVYVTDELAHNLEHVHGICKANDVQLRCVLNDVPATAIARSYKDVVFDPRTIDELAKYFDVFEFYGLDRNVEKSKSKMRVLMRAFFEQKDWYGELNEINDGIPCPYDLKYIDDDIATYKYNCRKRCESHADSRCQKCRRVIQDRQQIYKQKGIGVRRKD